MDGTPRAGADPGLAGMVLCAGLGTRLRPLTSRVPKPAVPVGGVPLVRYALALLSGAGVSRAVVNVHHLAVRMEETARASAAALGLALDVSREPVIAGTGGALREARALLASARELVLVNGDILFDVDLPAALEAHRRSGALATLLLAPMPAGAAYAAVEVDGGGRVRRIAGRFGPGGDGLLPWHFTGVHLLSARLLDLIPAAPFELDVNRDLYPPLMASGAVRGLVAGGYWNDLGTPARYLDAHEELLQGGVPLGRFRGASPFEGAEHRGPRIWCGPGAVVEPGARLRGPLLLGAGSRVETGAAVGPLVTLGAGAVVGRGARLDRAVVWDETTVAPGEQLVRAIAAGGDRVPG